MSAPPTALPFLASSPDDVARERAAVVQRALVRDVRKAEALRVKAERTVELVDASVAEARRACGCEHCAGGKAATCVANTVLAALLPALLARGEMP